MNRGHLSDDELIGLVYGLGHEETHLATCAECAGRFNAMRRTRAESVSTEEISGRMLAVQRQQILNRVKQPSLNWRWIPAAAIAAVLAVAVILSRPPEVSSPVPAVNSDADAELFTDVYSMERDVEPRAAAPMRALFQETSFQPPAPAEELRAQ